MRPRNRSSGRSATANRWSLSTTGLPRSTPVTRVRNPAGQIARTLIIPKVLEGSGLEILTRPDMRDHVLRETTEAKRIGTENVDGIATEHFRVDWHGAVLDLWIGA